MKFKYIALIVITLLFWSTTQAQIKFGIRAGLNSSRVKLNEFDNTDYTLDYKSSKVGFHVGGIAQLKMGMIVIQPELLFTLAKTDVSLYDIANDSTAIGRQSFNKIDLPIIFGIKFGPLKLQVGPVASIILKSKSDLLDDHNINYSMKGATFGYQAGIGLELGSLLLDVKYEGSLSKLGDGITIAGQQFNFDQRLNQIILSIGYLL